jgi:hypothetical protein
MEQLRKHPLGMAGEGFRAFADGGRLGGILSTLAGVLPPKHYAAGCAVVPADVVMEIGQQVLASTLTAWLMQDGCSRRFQA